MKNKSLELDNQIRKIKTRQQCIEIINELRLAGSPFDICITKQRRLGLGSKQYNFFISNPSIEFADDLAKLFIKQGLMDEGDL